MTAMVAVNTSMLTTLPIIAGTKYERLFNLPGATVTAITGVDDVPSLVDLPLIVIPVLMLAAV